MRKNDLEMKLEELQGFKEPDAELEQYPTPFSVAAELLWQAYMKGDIEGKEVFDLGCGTGILAIGAKLLGASEVTGVDVDSRAIETSRKNADKMGVDISFEVMDIEEVQARGDTVVQNPPFGSQSKGNDRPFIKKALEVAPVVYSFHLTETQDFIHRFVSEVDGRVTHVIPVEFPLHRTMPWHEKDLERIDVSIYRFVRA